MTRLPSHSAELLHALVARLEQRSCLPVGVLDGLAAGTLPPQDAGRALAHVQSCLACLSAFARLQSLHESASPDSAADETAAARVDDARNRGRAAARRPRASAVSAPRRRAERAAPSRETLIDTPSSHALRIELRHLAGLDRGPGDAPPIVITGENGTGRAVVAEAIHDLSRRASGPFVVMRCGELPEHGMELAMFGRDRDAFQDSRAGAFEMADGGTLLVDGVHRLPLDLQAKLLDALSERSVRRLGGAAARSVEVRVIAATDVDLDEAVRRGAFRADLLDRLKELRLSLRPLRERPDDIVPLARHFADRFARERGLSPVRLSAETEARLRRHHWPGNVRELSRVMEAAAVRHAGREIEPADLGLAGS